VLPFFPLLRQMVVIADVGAFAGRESVFACGGCNGETAAEADGIKSTVSVETVGIPEHILHGGCLPRGQSCGYSYSAT